MIRLEDILDTVESYKPDFDEELIRRAYVFSAMAHKDQTRRSGEPYLVHPLNVAMILAEMKLDESSICVGLLHDVLEDTLTTKEKLNELFGEDVAEVVDGLTKIAKYAYVSKEEQQAETFRKMILAMASDLRVILVKLADRLHNMRTLEHMPEERQRSIAQETLEIYAPIANRLGMGRVKGELEDLSFRYLHPREHRELQKAVREKMAVSSEIVERIRSTLAETMKSNQIEAEVLGRVKTTHSIHQKLRRQGIDIGQLYDYLAFRIVVPSIRDCYMALGLIHQMWRPVPGRIKDYIAMPKPNFYQSLHTTVVAERGQPFEVQIRTREMDLIAEQGIAAHWKYKEGRIGLNEDDRNFLWLRQLVEWQQEVQDPRVFLNSLKLDLYPDEVYTFTPKGDVYAFPRGATPLDFAYRVHTDLGHHCVGTRVNGKLVPLRSELRNGDIVEIFTSPGQTPNQEWLSIVKTSRARHKIRQWLSNEQKNRSTELGRRLVEREAKRYKRSLKKLLGSPEFGELLGRHGFNRPDELFASVGFGKHSAKTLLQELIPEDEKVKHDRPVGPIREAVRRIFPFGPGAAIRVKGYDDLLTYLARCCSPLPGEDIVGYITRGKGVAVHSSNCPNVKNLLFNPDRQIDVEWGDGGPAQFQVDLEIAVEDRAGVLAKVVAAIANMKTNIRNIDARASGGRGRIGLSLEIADQRHLDKLIRSISGLDGVLEVERRYRGRQASAV
jgi:GTP diphosphokinase / guanosine-3',5'-bis(diphosphate) 3'-diphosphatase